MKSNSTSVVKDYGILSIMYHRFDENKYPSTNIKLDDFKSHINLIENSEFEFISHGQFEDSIKKNNLSKKILLTIDDGFYSFYKNAWPILKEKKIPFIIFINTKTVGSNGYMSWSQIKEISQFNFVHIGNHSHSHAYLVDKNDEEIKKDLQTSIKIFKEKLNHETNFFAYPFGEYKNSYKKIVQNLGFQYAFGQHSGAINRFSDKKYLPRFALNEQYGALNRFKLIVNTLPLPVSEFTPKSLIIGKTNPPNVGFTVIPSLKNLNRISCFTSEEGKVATTLLGTSRVEVRMTKPFIKGRNRLNCTLPGRGGRWHWLGAIFVVPKI